MRHRMGTGRTGAPWLLGIAAIYCVLAWQSTGTAATERTPETAVLEQRIESLSKESAVLQEQVQVFGAQAEQLAQQAVVAEAKLQAAVTHERSAVWLWIEKAIKIMVILFFGGVLFLLLKRGIAGSKRSCRRKTPSARARHGCGLRRSPGWPIGWEPSPWLGVCCMSSSKPSGSMSPHSWRASGLPGWPSGSAASI